MSYPFYLGESLAAAAASRDISAFTNLVKRNFDVVMDTRSQSGTMRKLRVVQLESLISRAIYRAGAHPDRLFEMGMHFLEEISRLRVHQREELSSVLIRFSTSAMTLIPQFPRSHPNLLQRFLTELERDQQGRLSVELVAGKLHVSASHLSRVVKLATGRSPSEYIRISRLSRARERLAETSVTQSALETGFGKVSSFIALFRKYYGETPGAYKRRLTLGEPPQYSNTDQILGISGFDRGIASVNRSLS